MRKTDPEPEKDKSQHLVYLTKNARAITDVAVGRAKSGQGYARDDNLGNLLIENIW